MKRQQWIGPATFVLTLVLSLLGRRQESFDEAGRNLVSRHEARAEIAQSAQRECGAHLNGLEPLQRFLEADTTARRPASAAQDVVFQ